MKNLILLSFIIHSTISLKAQDIKTSTLSWSSNRTVNLKNEDYFNYSCIFKTTPTAIDWVQKGGAYITRYQIISTEGTWTDITKPGKVTYQVKRDDMPGTLIFERNEVEITVTIDFSKQDSKSINQRFVVSSVQPAN
jgi:hypothetical protein